MEQKGDKFQGKIMADPFGSMDEAFGTIPGELAIREPREVVVEPKITETVSDAEQDNDFAVVRETLHRILDKSEDALDDMLHIAKASENARSFEVAANLIKTISDVADQLTNLHKKRKDLNKAMAGNNRDDALIGATEIGQQNNIVFTGSASELMAAINEKRLKDVN